MRSEHILRQIEMDAERLGLPIIGPYKAAVFREILKQRRPRNSLEIGTLVGYSAIVIASEMPENGKLICLEVSDEWAKAARENIEKAGLSEKVEILVGDAVKILPQLRQKFDLIFIDASKEQYLDYLKLSEKNLRKGSMIIADNARIFAREMGDYLDYVRNSGKYSSRYIFVPMANDAVEVSIRL
ncbi:MAG: O-methyltransferase [Candidatus Aenigmarchaeota archaeon]|nr:O-methyltransferase [Candidatus Aenigmarchaeota archaeon]